MSFLPQLLSNSRYVYLPQGLAGRLVAGIFWLVGLIGILLLLRAWGAFNRLRTRRYWWVLVALTILVPLTSLFVGVRLAPQGSLPLPDVPDDPGGPAMMIFMALPWILAGGLLGAVPAVGLGMISGLLLTLWDTHNVFTILEFAGLALLFSAAVHQRYRTRVYVLLRHPLLAAILVAAVYPLFSLISATLIANGTLAERLDYAISRLGPVTLAVGLPVILAGVFAEVIATAWQGAWGRPGFLVPSPAERSLQARFLYGTAPLAFILAILLMAGDWVVAGAAARQILRDRMADTATLASEGIPYFLGAGQNLITQLDGDARLYTSNPDELITVLGQDLRTVPFFTQLFVMDSSGKPLAGFPLKDYAGSKPSPEEQMGIRYALSGVPYQSYTAPPGEGEKAAQISFVAAIRDGNDRLRGVLVGRTRLAENPFSKPILASLDSLVGVEGEGILLDDEGRILYHPNPALLMLDYTGRTTETADFYSDTAPDGTRKLVYYQPATGSSWGVVLTVPARSTQQIALNIAGPLLGMIILLAFFSVVLLRYGLRVVTGSLKRLALQAANISQGQLDTPMQVNGEDEVGQLSRAFEQMRLSLRARLEELNRLLLVSQGVASSLEMSQAVQPVLEAALGTGACSARVVLTPETMPELEGSPLTPAVYALGSAGESYAHLDGQVLGLAENQDQVLINNLSRQRLIQFKPGAQRPQALTALPLRHENQYYGALWVAFDKPYKLSDEEMRFLVTLAGQAALAAANARLYMNAEIGRQRLAAILASTPEPVLVTDHENHLLLSNPAAWRALGLGVEWDEGQPIERVITDAKLLDLIQSGDDKPPVEVTLPDGRVYFATASSVTADGHHMGRVCILRDVTSFKELDSLKSDFVATVSHDLRSPLTLMRGYATMLEMVGELNDQQTGYVRKIVTGVESMSRLVSNLLDLGRIEAGIDLQLEMVPVQDLVERVVSALQLQATQKRVQLVNEFPQETAPLIEADQALLQQALHNLVDNAIKYTDSGGKVTVRVYTRQENVIFEVQDTGIGIAPVDVPRLFEKFYRVTQQGAKKQGGSGLGLAIVKSIAERHGGTVSVDSQLGKGSTFIMTLPLRQNKAHPDLG
jgi:signal transduction histidine kinase